MGRRLRKNRDQFLHLSKAHIPNICLCQIKPGLSKNPLFYQTSFSYMFLCRIQSIEKSFNLFRNASSPPYIHLSPPAISDNFDRFRLEFVGFKKVVFVVRLLGSLLRRSIHGNPLAWLAAVETFLYLFQPGPRLQALPSLLFKCIVQYRDYRRLKYTEVQSLWLYYQSPQVNKYLKITTYYLSCNLAVYATYCTV